MPEIPLVAEHRAPNGTGGARRLRGDGRIPGVLYGHGVEPLPLSVDARELRAALSTEAGANALFDLRIGTVRHLAITRELQRHPVRHAISHVDFQVVSRDELVPAEVPIHLVGDASRVTRDGGNVEQLLTAIAIHARPGEIPSAFELDISELEYGMTLRVSELAVPDGITVDVDPDTAIVVGLAPRGVEVAEAAPEDEGAAAAEPEQAGREN